MSSTRTELPYIEALDGLRGLAVFAILLFHAGHLRGGWLGVDLFFVLSGFLITSLLLTEYEASRSVSLVSFWGRRARRLLPALFLTLLGIAAYAVVIARPEELERIRADATATLFYVANWHAIFAGHDYWEMFRAASPLDHSWSLAIEEQFYLVWPPLVLVALRRWAGSARTITKIAVVLALASAAWMAAVYDPDQSTARAYFGTDTRAFATLAGAATAGVLRSRVRTWPGASRRGADVAAICAFVLLVAASVVLDGSSALVYRGGLAVLALASCVIVAGVVLAPAGIVSQVLSRPPLTSLGRISYGVYLWHWPIYLVLTPERTELSGALLTGMRVSATLLVAGVSYFALERPVRRGVLRAGIGGAACAAAGVLGCVWFATLTPTVTPTKVARPGPQREGTPKVLLIGDSLAHEVDEEFRREAQRRGLSPHVMAEVGCGALQSSAVRSLAGEVFDLRGCLGIREGWIAAVASERPAFVVLMEGWAGVGEKQVAGRWSHPCEPHFDAAYEADLAALIESFSERGATSVVGTVPPPLVADLPARFARLWGEVDAEALDARFRERSACQNRVRARVARRTGAIFVDLGSELCPDGRCIREIDGHVLRPDGIHFTGTGASWASARIFDRIAEHQ